MSFSDDVRQKKLYALILEARRDEAVGLLEESIEVAGFRPTVVDLLDPVLRTIGERWSLDSISLAQVYVAGKVAEDLLGHLKPKDGESPPPAPRGIAVLGNAEDDYHGLGRRMVGTFLRIDGWIVHDLGDDVLATTFVDEALRTGASVIGVSAMMLTNARNIVRVREELEKRGLSRRIGLAVGGAVFALRPGLVREVGGDGTAANAVDAATLFDKLSAERRMDDVAEGR